MVRPPASGSSDFCPVPPKLSYSASSNARPNGLFETQNVYIAEVLLNLAENVGTRTFFDQYQAGFTLNVREPPHSTCGCANSTENCDNSSPLTTSGSTNSASPHYSVNQLCAVAHSLCQYGGDCSQLDALGSFCDDLGVSLAVATGSTSLSCSDSNQTSYSVDGLSSDLLQVSQKKLDLKHMYNTI